MSELQQRKRPWYTEDILYIIAERLLARIPDQNPPSIDFRERNCYTYFMSHKEMAMRTTISQFAKFKRIVFSKDGEEKIEFYKNDSFKLYGYGLQSEEFGGPYYVPPGMLEYIIENGKLRVDTIKTQRFLRDDHCVDIKEYGEMNSLKAFCALFLGKQVQIPDGLINNLLVEKFCIDEKTMIIQNNFEAILAIDAVELKLDIWDMHTNFIDCSQYNSPIIAKNTTKITVACDFNFHSSKEDRDKFVTNFETFCPYIIRVCPNLNNLQFKILSCTILESVDSSLDEYTDNLYSTIKAMETGIKSINIGKGNEHLQISIELLATFIPTCIYDKLPIQSHDLFKLGSPSTVENDYQYARYIARSLECVDACGRIHKLQFNIAVFRNWYNLLNLFGYFMYSLFPPY